MQENLIKLTVEVDRASAAAKEEKKRRKNIRALLLLEECKTHGGPITPACLQLLEHLTHKELLQETRYLRAPIAPHIKERRCVVDSDGKKKMPRLSIDSMRENIKLVLDKDSVTSVSLTNICVLVEKAFGETK